MTSSFLATGDIHLTDDPRDEYRWRVFKFLRKMAEKYNVEHIVILGDLTDKKDCHSAKLVNRVVDELNRLPGRVVAMMGNHDYSADPTTPFFKFLGNVTDQDIACGADVPKTEFISVPQPHTLGTTPCFFIPHVRKTEGHVWPTIPAGTRFVFMHQTFSGCVVENGTTLDGLAPDTIVLPPGCEIVSGDIHVPQKLKGITYAGAPHPVRFGDSFQPRVLHFDGTKLRSLNRNTIRKDVVTIKKIADLYSADGPCAHLTKDDQVKVRVLLRRRDFPEWPAVREEVFAWARELEIRLAGCRVEERQAKDETAREKQTGERRNVRTPEELFRAFCSDRSIDPVYEEAGRKWLRP